MLELLVFGINTVTVCNHSCVFVISVLMLPKRTTPLGDLSMTII